MLLVSSVDFNLIFLVDFTYFLGGFYLLSWWILLTFLVDLRVSLCMARGYISFSGSE
jgi:hypothetical protein